jgi:hypothetical protein
VRWNGKSIDDPPLTLDEDAGLQQALDELSNGGGVDDAEAQRHITAPLRR